MPRGRCISFVGEKGDNLLFTGNRVVFRDLVFAFWPNLALQTDRLTAPAITSLERTPLRGERPVLATPAGPRPFIKRARVVFTYGLQFLRSRQAPCARGAAPLADPLDHP